MIRFRRKTPPEWMVLFILAMPFLLSLLTELFSFPSLVKYTLDIAWIFLLGYICINRIYFHNVWVYNLLKVVILFFVITLVGFLGNYQSILYYFWGLRNNFRFYVFFFSCIVFLNPDSLENFLIFFEKLFWINFPVVLFQFIVLHKAQDYLGGIFGTLVGCNSYMNILLIIVVAKSILYFMHKKENLKLCALKCCVALVVAVLSELKVFFIEFLLILLLGMLMTKFSYRKLIIMIGGVVGIFVGAQFVALLFPDFSNWFNLDSIMEMLASERGYTGRNGINRLTAVAYTLNNFLPTITDKLFGLGLGNCDYASFDFLITPFYRDYKWTRYFWFSSSFLVLETGIIGLAIYVSFFVMLFYGVHKLEKKTSVDPIYCQLAKIMAVMCGVMIMYNSALRTEAAYMMYFVLALPFIKQKKQSATLINNKGE